MQNIDQLKQQCVDKANECLAKYGMSDWLVSIDWVSGKRWAGQAYVDHDKIFNKICQLDLCVDFLIVYTDKFIEEIVTHEVAHVITAFMYPNRKQDHGPEWRYVMRFFGVEPSTCHSFKVTNISGKFEQFQCGCTTHLVSKNKATRIHNGAVYKCQSCGTKLAKFTILDESDYDDE